MSTDSTPAERSTIPPLGLVGSILLFAIPAAILYGFVYILIPALESAGLSPFMAYLIGLMVPLILMFAAALVAYRLEGNPPAWAAFKERYRFKPMTGRDWLWTVGLTIFAVLSYFLMLQAEVALIAAGVITIPDFVPDAIDPRKMGSLIDLSNLMGGQVKGNWTILITLFVLLFFNIFGEELWWRGYILPRQEPVFGKWTWLLHGTLWALFHVFKWWDVLALLPVTLSLSYVAQRRQNTWPGIICHYVTNGLSLIGLILLVTGVINF